MSHLNLLHLTSEEGTGKISGLKSREASRFLADASEISNFDSWIVDEKEVCKEIASSIINGHTDFVSAFKDVTLIAEAKTCAGASYEKLLEQTFRYVIEINPKTDLSLEEIVEISELEHPEDFIIGGHVDKEAKILILFRGNCSMLVVSFNRFKKNGQATPDFSKLKIIDHGKALSLGSYEASIYPLLYEVDPDYRKRLSRQRKAEDKSFGACLYRARNVLGLTQDDFPGIRRETIIRIENRKSKTLRANTKKLILAALNLQNEEDLLSY